MKKFIVFSFLILFVLTCDVFSQTYGASNAYLVTPFSSTTYIGRNVTFDHCGLVATVNYAGVIPARLDTTANTPFYCLDACTNITPGDSVRDSLSSISKAIYITSYYYPARTSYTGKLADNRDEAAAVQLAIWHFRNAVDINTVTAITGSTVTVANYKLRVQAIIDDVNLNGGFTQQKITIKINPGINPDDLYIETLDTAGNHVAVTGIKVKITGTGILSDTLVNTNASGISPNITVTGGSAGDEIQASGRVQVPGGVTYGGIKNGVYLQLLVLGRLTTAIRTTRISWGALPVELSSFTAGLSGNDITLNWSTTKEINNSGYEIERNVIGDTWEKIGFVAGHGNTSSPQDYSYNDRNLTSGIYTYRLKQIDYNGNFEYFDLNGEVIVGVPNNFELSQNFPNPFNPSTKINYQIPNDAIVSIKVFDNSGKEVSTLVNGSMTAGFHSVNFYGSNLSSGVYFYKLETNGFTKVMKMALVK